MNTKTRESHAGTTSTVLFDHPSRHNAVEPHQSLPDSEGNLKPVRDIKKRNHEFTISPIHEFKVLRNVF